MTHFLDIAFPDGLDASAEQLLNSFESAWNSGIPNLEVFLAQHADQYESASVPQQVAILAELIMVDMERRWRIAPCKPSNAAPTGNLQDIAFPSVEQYAAAFPIVGACEDVLADLACHEFQIRGVPPSIEDYMHRFNGLAPTMLVPRLRDIAKQHVVEIGKAQAENTTVNDPGSTAGEQDDYDSATSTLVEDWSLTLSDADTVHATDPMGLPRRIRNYELINPIRAGSMGQVWLARQVGCNRLVAVKMILSGQFATPFEKERFLNEAETLGALQHPNIVAMHDYGEAANVCFYAMDLNRHGDLADWLRNGAMEPRTAAQVVSKIARAVAHAHEHQIIHRDLKPANVLMTEDGQPKVTDFGLAKRLDSSSRHTLNEGPLGTPAYMPPEQIDRTQSTVGVASDVYSIGAILYHAITGQPPFHAASVAETLRQVLEDEPVHPSHIDCRIPRDLAEIANKCLQKDSQHRYASAAQLADELDRFVRGEVIEEPRKIQPGRTATQLRRLPSIALSIAVLGTFAVMMVSFLWGLIATTAVIGALSRTRPWWRIPVDFMRRVSLDRRGSR
ncbi:MAG: serine/threonine-protein kinase, partial [Planctomycetota bacterium]|nr:serine/threonine-protein kinase [Planctomycetota bacterium]